MFFYLMFLIIFSKNDSTFLDNPNFKTEKLTDEEAYAIITHPIYSDIYSQKKKNERKFLEIKTGVSLKQFKQNTGNVVTIGAQNIFPTIFFNGTVWLLDWIGITSSWERGHLFTSGERAPGQSALIMPTWFNIGGKIRYNFDKRDGSSYLALKMMYHEHRFPVTTQNLMPTLKFTNGFSLGAQRSFALNPRFGFDFNFDFILLDKIEYGNGDLYKQGDFKDLSGLAYSFVVDFYGSVIDRYGLKTMITVGYSLSLYSIPLAIDQLGVIYNSTPGGESVKKNFQQIYQGLHLTFTARI